MGIPVEPVDLQVVADFVGVAVALRPFGPAYPEGMYVSDGVASLVVVNTGVPLQKHRFTLAHEIGHHVLHGKPGQALEVVDANVGLGSNASLDETAANAFAAHLLLPDAALYYYLGDRRGHEVVEEDVLWCIRTHRVSWAVACYRLQNAGYVNSSQRVELANRHGKTAFLASRGVNQSVFIPEGGNLSRGDAEAAARLWADWIITDGKLAQLLDMPIDDAISQAQVWGIERTARVPRDDAGDLARLEALGIDLDRAFEDAEPE